MCHSKTYYLWDGAYTETKINVEREKLGCSIEKWPEVRGPGVPVLALIGACHVATDSQEPQRLRSP